MKILALDIGIKRIGIAKWNQNENEGIVLPLQLVQYQKPGEGLAEILNIIDVEKPSALVLGYPLGTNGKTGEMTRLVDRWRSKLGELTNLKVHLCDERMTSRLATQNLSRLGVKQQKRKAAIDMAAAVLILETWLHSHNFLNR